MKIFDLKYVVTAAMLISLVSLSVIAQSTGGIDDPARGGMRNDAMPALSTADQRFFSTAAIGGMTEIAAGRLATTQGSTDEIRSFGQRMVDDHSKAATALTTLAQSKNVTLPEQPDTSHQAMLDSLKSKQGKAFDLAFLADMRKGHAQAIRAFAEASKSSDSDVAKFAATTLPTLKDHQKHIPVIAMKADPGQSSDTMSRQ